MKSLSCVRVVSTNYRVLICCTCHFQGDSLCFSFFCLLVSSVSDFCPDTKGALVDTYFRLTCSVGLWEGGTVQTNNTGTCSQCLGHTGTAPTHGWCTLPAHTAQGRLLPREPSKAGPGLSVLIRSKPLRFRHSGSPQRCRLSWACVLCSSQVHAAQVMRCLVSANAATYRLPATRLSGCKTGAPSQADPDPQ